MKIPRFVTSTIPLLSVLRLVPIIIVLLPLTSIIPHHITSAHYIDDEDYDFIMERVRGRQEKSSARDGGDRSTRTTMAGRHKRSARSEIGDLLDVDGNCPISSSNDTLAKASNATSNGGVFSGPLESKV